MRKIALIISIGIIIMSPIKAKASDYASEWLKKQQAEDEKFMDKLAKDGNLTQEAIDSITKGKSKRKPNRETNKEEIIKSEAKGWVYSTDELHIIGLPEDERGYTKAGDYGIIE